MIPLRICRRVLSLVYVYPFEKGTSIWKKILCVIFTFIFFITAVSAFISSVLFFSGNFSTNIEQSLYSLFQIAAFSSLTYMTIVLFYSRKELTGFLDKLTQLYEAS